MLEKLFAMKAVAKLELETISENVFHRR